MTLEEYQAQSPPVRLLNGIVRLKPSEYALFTNLAIRPNKFLPSLTPVTVNDYPLHSYVKKEDDTTLWTTDTDGNPKTRSVFSIEI